MPTIPLEVENSRQRLGPQEQEDTEKGAKIWEGKYLAEGTSPWELQDPTEWATTEKADKWVAEIWEVQDLADDPDSQESGALRTQLVQVW